MSGTPEFRWQAVGRRKTSVARVYLTPGTGKWDINGRTLGECVHSPEGRVARVVAAEKDDRKVIEEVYLACLNRPPTDKELTAVSLGEGNRRLENAQDLEWALLNSPEFVLSR